MESSADMVPILVSLQPATEKNIFSYNTDIVYIRWYPPVPSHRSCNFQTCFFLICYLDGMPPKVASQITHIL